MDEANGVPSARVVDAALKLWAQSAEINTIPVRGNSMKPLLHDGDQVRIQHGVRGIAVGDIIVFRQRDTLVVHRVVRIRLQHATPHFVTKGDNVRHFDPPVLTADVLGKVLAVERGGQSLPVTSRGWRLFGRIVAFTGRLWATPYSRLRNWKRDRVGNRPILPVRVAGRLYLSAANAAMRVAERLLGSWQRRERPD